MRRFWNVKKDQMTIKESPPSLPKDIDYSQLIHMTKRGFIAKKFATYLEMDTAETDHIYFLSLSQVHLDSPGEENIYEAYLYYSECLLQWMENGDDISKKMDTLTVTNQEKNALLKVYDIYKKQLVVEASLDVATYLEPPVDKWTVYRDVMYSATQCKFLLITKEELEVFKTGKVLMKHDIKVISDIPKCRNQAQELLTQRGYQKSALMSFLLVISEAVTNSLKHAEQGIMSLIEDDHEIRVVVEDNGPGFELESLPNATLLAGYSTKKSLGQGFQLMLKMAKQVMLYTSCTGSTIVITFEGQTNGEMPNG